MGDRITTAWGLIQRDRSTIAHAVQSILSSWAQGVGLAALNPGYQGRMPPISIAKLKQRRKELREAYESFDLTLGVAIADMESEWKPTKPENNQ